MPRGFKFAGAQLAFKTLRRSPEYLMILEFLRYESSFTSSSENNDRYTTIDKLISSSLVTFLLLLLLLKSEVVRTHKCLKGTSLHSE